MNRTGVLLGWWALALPFFLATAQTAPPSCKASQLTATEDRNPSEGMDGGLGHQSLTILLQNRSSLVCALQGVPKLTLEKATNKPAPAHVCPNCPDYLFDPQPVKTVLLLPSRSAYVKVGYPSICRKADVVTFRLFGTPNALRIVVTGMFGANHLVGLVTCGAFNVTPYLEKPLVEGHLPN